MTKVVFLRHTRVAVDPGLCYGHTDVPLAASFDTECAAIQETLGNWAFDQVITSPLQRCVRLALALIPSYTPIQIDSRIMELNFGHWEGRLWDDFASSPEAQSFFADYVHRPCPGGESFMQLIGRVDGFLQDLRMNHPSKTLLVVTHAGCIRAAQALVEGMSALDAFGRKTDYGAVYAFDI
jgi:alpha-ribazole phosphatase